MRLCRGSVLLFVLVAALTMGGCIKFKQAVTVMPDGSGKIEFRMGFNQKGIEEAAAAMGQGDAGMEDPFDMDASDFDNMHGFVAFTEPKQEEKDGWKFVTFTGYFEDVNKVELSDKDDAEEKQLTFAFAKNDAGYSLKAKSVFKDFGQMSQMGDMGNGEDLPPEMKGMMEGMKKMVDSLMESFEFEQLFTVPGAISNATGQTSFEGRTARYAVTAQEAKDPKAAAKLAELKEIDIQCGASAVTEADLAAFKAELTKAKEEWVKLKAEAEKKASEEPAEPMDEGGDEGGEGEGEGTK